MTAFAAGVRRDAEGAGDGRPVAPRRHLWLGAVALLLALPGAWIDRRMFFACWLAAWWLCLSAILGALCNAGVHRLTGGGWGAALRPATLLLARRLPWVLLLFLPLLLGLGTLYPWFADPSGAWREPMARPQFNRLWFDPLFFGLRLVGYGAVWWWLARPATLIATTRGRAAAALAAYAVATTLAAIDLLMSLQPVFYSTGFGLLALSAQALAGSALTVGLTARWGVARVQPAARGAPPVWRDLGNLLLMWVMIWAYLAFMQLLIIWAENLPREIAWYVPRLQTGWIDAGVALLLLQFALPLLALLMRSVKDRPRRLAPVAWLLLGAGALDAAWLVLPSVAPASLHGWWLLPLLVAGMGSLLFGAVPAALRREPAGRTTCRRETAKPAIRHDRRPLPAPSLRSLCMPAADNVSVGRIGLAGAGIVATVVVVVAVIVVELREWGVPLDGARSTARRVDIPGAELQAAPHPDLLRYQAEKQRQLEATGWVDATAGIARIPIGQAMALLSERGLRAAGSAPAASAGEPQAVPGRAAPVGFGSPAAVMAATAASTPAAGASPVATGEPSAVAPAAPRPPGPGVRREPQR